MDKQIEILSKMLGCSISNLEKIQGHLVYILSVTGYPEKCVKIIYGHDNNYELRYRKLELLGLVPKMYSFIYTSMFEQELMILVNEYIPSPSQIDKTIEGPLIMGLVNKLHSYGYIHGDITEPKNIVIDKYTDRAFFIDIDSTFHVDDKENLDVDLELEYGTNCLKKIMEFEKKVVAKRLTH